MLYEVITHIGDAQPHKVTHKFRRIGKGTDDDIDKQSQPEADQQLFENIQNIGQHGPLP